MGDELTSSTYEATTSGSDLNNNVNRYQRHGYNDFTNEMPYKSCGSEETKQYLRRFGNNVYVDSNPEIIRRPANERPVTYEQRIMLRCLQPPLPPPPEPLIIKEVRPEQPPLPPTVVIHEHGRCSSQPPPLILRERPPELPPHIASETIIRNLPQVHLPPRSLVVERFPDCPEKPRDIIIERWLPYPPAPARRQIIEHAPPPMKYPAPTHTVILYDSVPSNIVRKFERLGITQEDPEAYIARYGETLLDRDTLLQQARNAGIYEDISCPLLASSEIPVDRSNDVIIQESSLSGGYNYYGERPQFRNTEVTNIESERYSSSTSHSFRRRVVTDTTRSIRSEYHIDDTEEQL